MQPFGGTSVSSHVLGPSRCVLLEFDTFWSRPGRTLDCSGWRLLSFLGEVNFLLVKCAELTVPGMNHLLVHRVGIPLPYFLPVQLICVPCGEICPFCLVLWGYIFKYCELKGLINASSESSSGEEDVSSLEQRRYPPNSFLPRVAEQPFDDNYVSKS